MASSTRQLGIADALHLQDRVSAVLLAGGSAFGLDAAAGVMSFLEERGIGFSTVYGEVPIVPTAILFDLGLGDPKARPSPEMAYLAAERASIDVEEGCVGAGAGATVGKLLSVRCATKGGIGTWGERSEDGLVVGALAAVNAFGDVFDPGAMSIIAGARRAPDSLELVDMTRQIKKGHMRTTFGQHNTTLAVVATNAKLPDLWLRRAAWWASEALALHLRPAFTAVDGDVIMVLSTEELETEPHRLGIMAQEVLGKALLRAVLKATPLGGLPAASELTPIDV